MRIRSGLLGIGDSGLRRRPHVLAAAVVAEHGLLPAVEMHVAEAEPQGTQQVLAIRVDGDRVAFQPRVGQSQLRRPRLVGSLAADQHLAVQVERDRAVGVVLARQPRQGIVQEVAVAVRDAEMRGSRSRIADVPADIREPGILLQLQR